jgi:hypothetical protein
MSVLDMAIDLLLKTNNRDSLPTYVRSILLAFADGTDGEKSYIIQKLRYALWVPDATDWSCEVAAILLIAIDQKFNNAEANETVEEWINHPPAGKLQLADHLRISFATIQRL